MHLRHGASMLSTTLPFWTCIITLGKKKWWWRTLLLKNFWSYVIHSEIKPPLLLGWTMMSSGSSDSTLSYFFLNAEFFTLPFEHFLLPFLCCKIIWSSASEASDFLRLGLKINIVLLILEFKATLLTGSNNQFRNY